MTKRRKAFSCFVLRHSFVIRHSCFVIHHNTSGASETIFMKLRSRSSRATGPKIRVPRGFKSLSMMTIALLSKRRNEPSSRRIGCRVRTRTARTTSPFFTVPVALASFTFAVITSPIPAYSVDLPITPIIVAMRAPVLSATSNLDRSCTIRSTIYSHIISELLLNHFQQTPALEFAQRARFHDAHHVAGFCFVLLIVRVKLSHLLNDLAELRMRHARDRPHHDRLVHATRNHFAGARLARSAGQRRWQWRWLGK